MKNVHAREVSLLGEQLGFFYFLSCVNANPWTQCLSRLRSFDQSFLWQGDFSFILFIFLSLVNFLFEDKEGSSTKIKQEVDQLLADYPVLPIGLLLLFVALL